LDFLDPEWMSVVRKQSQEKERAIKAVVIGMEAERAPFLEATTPSSGALLVHYNLQMRSSNANDSVLSYSIQMKRGEYKQGRLV
jgi:hypothetical protein